MDQQEPGFDQREQLLKRRRTKAEWEELALKLVLLNPKLAAEIRDIQWSQWRQHAYALKTLTYEHYADQIFLGILGIKYDAYQCNRIAKALRNLGREARKTLTPEARKREYDRYNKQR